MQMLVLCGGLFLAGCYLLLKLTIMLLILAHGSNPKLFLCV